MPSSYLHPHILYNTYHNQPRYYKTPPHFCGSTLALPAYNNDMACGLHGKCILNTVLIAFTHIILFTENSAKYTV